VNEKRDIEGQGEGEDVRCVDADFEFGSEVENCSHM